MARPCGTPTVKLPSVVARRVPDGPVAAFIVPPYPHPLLVPEQNPGYQRLRDAYDAIREEIERIAPDVVLLYSTQWLSVIGHQVQADPAPEWVHVDPEWHELGSIPYRFRMDAAFGDAYVQAGQARGLEMRTVAYPGFPIDTGTVVALRLLDPENRFPASVVSCNMYADRSETIVLGKAARDAIKQQGKRVVAIAVTAFSNRVFTAPTPFAEDRIHSQKDDEWNRKYLDFFRRGRLEDASQLARQFSREANGDQRMKAVWWLNAVMGQSNAFEGTIHAYEPVNGAGCAVVGLVPVAKAAEEAEFDEEDTEFHDGDRNVLGGVSAFEEAHGATLRNVPGSFVAEEARSSLRAAGPSAVAAATPLLSAQRPTPADPREDVGHPGAPASPAVVAPGAPKPVGAYPHARRVGGFLYLSGLGPRDPATDEVPGGPVWDSQGRPRDYDIEAQTEAVVRNMKTVLASAGCTIDDVVDVTCYLIDMQRDFAGFNKVYAKHFGDIQATRTTLEVNRLPTPIAVEFKVIAAPPQRVSPS